MKRNVQEENSWHLGWKTWAAFDAVSKRNLFVSSGSKFEDDMNRISNIKIAEPIQPDYPADLEPIVFGMKPEKKNYLHERKLIEQPTYSQIAYMAYE